MENNSVSGPDMQDVGVEVKYLPIYMDKRIPKEPTQITMIDFDAVCQETWEKASMRKKIERVFWVGYEVVRGAVRWEQTGLWSS